MRKPLTRKQAQSAADPEPEVIEPGEMDEAVEVEEVRREHGGSTIAHGQEYAFAALPPGRGRPSYYPQEPKELKRFLYLVTALCLLGATNEQLAQALEVDRTTIDLWIRKHPDFIRAIQKGRDDADARVAASLYERAVGYSHRETLVFQYKGRLIEREVTKHHPPDVAAAFIWLKNRRPKDWRDKKELTGPNDGPIKVQVMPEDEGL